MPGYEIIRPHPLFDVLGSVVENEIRFGNTILFVEEVDLTQVEELRQLAGARGQRKPSYTAIVMKAVALALREFPYANRRVYRSLPFGARRLQQFSQIDVAVAVERDVPDVECATFVDVHRNTDAAPLADLTEWLHQLVSSDETNNVQWRQLKQGSERMPRWLARRVIALPLHSPSMWRKWRGGAVLVSSPAKYGVGTVIGCWSSPIGVTFGMVRPRPMAIDGAVVVRPTFNFGLNWDRRVMAGAQAARFFRRVIEILLGATTELA
jgi:pyruvate/2-oxoglutarate dehydrogenase complex dihydrolipoamide acyltransferase (E2) component